MSLVETTLERLQSQVRNNQVKIFAACARVQDLIKTLCRDEMTRPLLTVLPKLLDIILGDEHEAGWIESATDEESHKALLNLLKPSGELFAGVQSLSIENLTPFELPILTLPVS